MIRLANNIDLLERMLSKLPKMEDELRTHKTLYVNKVGGFFIKATEDEIEDYDYSETRPFVENGLIEEEPNFIMAQGYIGIMFFAPTEEFANYIKENVKP